LKGYHLDPHPQANVADKHFAVIYAPKRKRDRFPSNNVTIYDTKEEAVSAQEPDKKLYAAEVMGPAKSSEGFIIFYLIEWLEL
jgi:hypothetical protein